MTAAVLYTSRYGYTESVARDVGARLGESSHVERVEVIEANRWTPVPETDAIIIGAPIYGGTISGGLVGCLELNMPALLARRLYFFLACLNDGDEAERQLVDSIPPQLVTHARGRFFVGARVQFDLLRWMDRQVMKRVAGITESIDRPRPDQVEALVSQVLSDL